MKQKFVRRGGKAAIIIVAAFTLMGFAGMPRLACGGGPAGPPPDKPPVEWQLRAVRGSGGYVEWHNSYPYAYWGEPQLPKDQWHINNCTNDILRFMDWEATASRVRSIVPYCGSGQTPNVGYPMTPA